MLPVPEGPRSRLCTPGEVSIERSALMPPTLGLLSAIVANGDHEFPVSGAGVAMSLYHP